MKPLLFALDAGETLAAGLIRELDLDRGEIERRHFPDGESYVRLLTEVSGRDVVFLCSLENPDLKTLPLLFAADAVRKQGARSIGIAASYLAYLRQDTSFHPGEAVTSATYAALLSKVFDWLVTVEPHLHRYPDLGSVYQIPAAATTAAQPIADWLCCNIERPFLVGPDEESSQWIERIANLAKARWTVLSKVRSGDFVVQIDGSALQGLEGLTPVIVDDIASSARTMIEAVRLLRDGGYPPPVCIAVHAIFAGDAWHRLCEAGPAKIVSSNTIVHETNAIDVTGPLAASIREMLARQSTK